MRQDPSSLRAALRLVLWWFLISSLILATPPPSPMKAYRPVDVTPYAALLLVPVGAWHASSAGGHPLVYSLYGVLAAAFFSMRLAAGGVSFILSDDEVFVRGTVCIACPIATAFLASYAAVLRWNLERRRSERGICKTCDYNLTGNLSGICPECGTAIPESVRQRLANEVRRSCD